MDACLFRLLRFTEMEQPRAWVSTIQFSDNTELQFKPGEIVVVVGPNNSGKSAALREINQQFRNLHARGNVVRALSIETEGQAEDLVRWLEESPAIISSARTQKSALTTTFIRTPGGNRISKEAAEQWWKKAKTEGLAEIALLFCLSLTTEKRLQETQPTPNLDSGEYASHPLHHLFLSEDLEKTISDCFRSAFREDLILSRFGRMLRLHVGPRPRPKKTQGEDRASPTYRQRIQNLPPLDQQGDGMRSYAGVLLNAVVGSQTLLLFDEPEAFLHPPQARLLALWLANSMSESSRQIFLATHSGDVVRGVIDSAAKNVHVIRLRRKGNVNLVSELDNSAVRAVWDDPLLRHSNILDGLFHDQVVVCEGDADCRFYSAITDALKKGRPTLFSTKVPLDTMFLHCGGKDRMPMVVRALRRLHVPVCVICDFDTLSSESVLRELVEITDTWDRFVKDYRLVRKALEGKKPELSSAEVKEEVGKVLDSISEEMFPQRAKREIKRLFRRSSPWSQAKQSGTRSVPSGDPTHACTRLLTGLAELGIHVVEVGELEGFCKSVGLHGPKWVMKVLAEKDLETDPELGVARDFVYEVVFQAKKRDPAQTG